MILRPTLVLIGGGATIERSKVLSVIPNTNSLPLRTYRKFMAERGMVVDVTQGRKVKSFILTDSNHMFLSSVGHETLKQRLESDDYE